MTSRRKAPGRPARPARSPQPAKAAKAAKAASRGPSLRRDTGEASSNRDLGGEQVEGRQAVAALLSAGRRPVRDVWIASGQDPAPVLERIVSHAANRGVRVIEVSRARLLSEAQTDAPQGVLAHAAPVAEADFDEMVRAGQDPPPFVLALDGVTDPHNLGALLRSAEAAGATGAVIPARRSAHLTPVVAKAAAGAIEHLGIAVVPGLPSALARAKELGCWVVGLAGEATHSIYDDDLAVATAPVVVVVGAEGAGLAQLVRRRCDVLVHIPMGGATESLNVSVAGALGLFEVARRRSAAARSK